MRLSETALPKLPGEISVPAYDRASLIPGILHFGVGNFHRAHQAAYLDELLACGGSTDWAVLGAGVMPADARMREGLESQQWLYSLVEQDETQESVRVVGSLAGFLPVGGGPVAVLKALEDPAIRIVSMTVTEGGYYQDSGTGAFDAEHPEILADIAAPGWPATVFGMVVAALRARREAGAMPFTVMSCDNVPHNGEAARAAVVGIAAGQDRGLGDWIAERVGFPNAMVDRITPATTEARRTDLRDRLGVDDSRPVFCEPFRQWVIEDRFSAGRPDLERVGVQFVPDVTPFENMKIRILNGGHAVMAYPAALRGIEYAHDAMADTSIGAFLARVERDEIVPITGAVPGVSLVAYEARIRERFSNPRIADTVRRLCQDGSDRQPKFVVPSVRDNLAAGGPVEGLALSSALWCRYCAGFDEAGATIEPNDTRWESLVERARQARDDPSKWLGLRQIYGDTGENERFAHAFVKALACVWEHGSEEAIRRYLAS